LIELLVVIGIIGILAAMVLPALSKAKEAGNAARCKSNLHQMGVGLQMYIDQYQYFPPYSSGPGSRIDSWFNQIYSPFHETGEASQYLHTNYAYHCPSYLAEGCILPPDNHALGFGSYAYNRWGVRTGAESLLGLDPIAPPTRASMVLKPSDMIAVGDSRPSPHPTAFDPPVAQPVGIDAMQFYSLSSGDQWPYFTGGGAELAAPHGGRSAYNLLFVDTHVEAVTRRNYLYPPVAAQRWNIDNQPHSDLWAPASEWAVQK
jgi:prepilin-type processing-associated H-X9-DG protein